MKFSRSSFERPERTIASVNKGPASVSLFHARGPALSCSVQTLRDHRLYELARSCCKLSPLVVLCFWNTSILKMLECDGRQNMKEALSFSC